MKRTERLKLIRDLIKTKKIASQEELIEELSVIGCGVTQSTISRDIKQLNLVKVRNSLQEEYYALSSKYQVDPQFNIGKIKFKFKENVLSVDLSNNIIVVKTNSGEAQGVAAVIDGSNFEEILGTVAGDDTIICVSNSEDNAKKILKFFQQL
ncbi:MAG: arginine repressor [Actinobacteria bacterium]|nr:arginine repressor [Actinomycetota bacterium]MCG2788622.1 arginine repressor [Actinomycetes bacterium]